MQGQQYPSCKVWGRKQEAERLQTTTAEDVILSRETVLHNEQFSQTGWFPGLCFQHPWVDGIVRRETAEEPSL